MAIYSQQSPYTSQPQRPADPVENLPFAFAVTADARGFYDHVTRQRFGATAGTSVTVDRGGQAVVGGTNAGSDGVPLAASSEARFFNSPGTLFVHLSSADFTAAQAPHFYSVRDGSTQSIVVGALDDNVTIRRQINLTIGGTSLATANDALFESQDNYIAVSWGAAGMRIYTRTGGLLASNGTTSTPANNTITPWLFNRSTGARGFAGLIYGAIGVSRQLDDAQIANGLQHFYGFLQETVVIPGAEVVGTTGTLATTNANDTLAASGNQTNTGSLATTNANDTLAASGNSVNTGTLAATNGDDTIAASGNQTNTGTLTQTNGNDTLAGAGNLVNTGTLAVTNANDTLSAAGSSGNDVIGTLATTNANDTLAASGDQTNTGTLATTNTNDSLAASGNQTNTGTSSTTNANDTLAATGAAGTITGEANITEGRDTLSASGTATTPSTSVGGGGAGGGKREILHARRRKPVKSADEELKELLDGVIGGVISPVKPVVQVTPKPAKEPVSLAKALASSIPSNITLAPAPVLRTEKQLLAEEEKAEMEALLHYFY